MSTKQEPANDDKKLLKATLTDPKEIERFLSLVQMSGLTQAEYIRRCCLNEEIIVVPQEHLDVYAQLGEIQVEMNNLCEKIRDTAKKEDGEQNKGLTAHAEETISLLTERIGGIKELRGLLLGIETESPKADN